MIKQIRKYRNFTVFYEWWWWRWHSSRVCGVLIRLLLLFLLVWLSLLLTLALSLLLFSSIKWWYWWWVYKSFICFWIYYCCFHICLTLMGRKAFILWSCSFRIISSDFLFVFYCLLYLFYVPYLLPLHLIFWRQSVTMWGWRTNSVICIMLSKVFEQSSKS